MRQPFRTTTSIFLLAFVASLSLVAQSVPSVMPTLEIARGRSSTADELGSAYDTIIVRGSLDLSNYRLTALRVNVLLVDGGELLFDRKTNDANSVFSLLGSGSPFPTLLVQRGGSVSISGRDAFTSELNLLVAADADSALFHGVRFAPLDTSRPAVVLHGGAVRVEQCTFSGISRQLVLDGVSGAEIINNTFEVAGATAIEVSPAGIGDRNRLINNKVLVSFPTPGDAMRIGNPLQEIRNNTISMDGEGVGIHYAPHQAYANHVWPSDRAAFILSSNLISAQQAGQGVGIVLPKMKFADYVTATGNRVAGSRIGAQLSCPRLIAGSWQLTDNEIGVELSAGRLDSMDIVGAGQDAGVGVIVPPSTRSEGLIINRLTVGNYPVGIEFRGDPGPLNQFTELHFERVDHPISVANVVDRPLYFPNGLPGADAFDHPVGSVQSTRPMHHGQPKHGDHSHDHDHAAMMNQSSGAHDDHAEMHEGHGMAKSVSVAAYLIPEGHLAEYESCVPYAGRKACSATSLGQLTVATGFGLSDPIHEHNDPLGRVTASTGGASFPLSSIGQSAQTFLAAGSSYQLRNDGLETHFDLSLTWESGDERPLLLTIPYPYASPTVSFALGNRVPRFSTRADVVASSTAAWLFDADAGAVTVALPASNGVSTLILYNEAVTTELTVKDRKVAVDQRFAADGALHFSYELPPGTPSKIVLTDVFGEAYQTLKGKATRAGKVNLRYLPEAGQAQPGWYFLYVGDQYFKGPVAYPERTK